jgi:hypothetical protein
MIQTPDSPAPITMATSSLRLRRQQDRQSAIKQQWVQLEVGGIILLVPLVNLHRVVDRADLGPDLRLCHEGNPVPIVDADRQIFGQVTFKETTIAIAILQGETGLSKFKLVGLAIGAKPTLCRLGDESFSPLPKAIAFQHIRQFIPGNGMPQYHLDVESLLETMV